MKETLQMLSAKDKRKDELSDGFGIDLQESADALMKAADEAAEQATNEMTTRAIQDTLDVHGDEMRLKAKPIALHQKARVDDDDVRGKI